MGSGEGKLPFAAAVPVTPYILNVERADLLWDFPIWLFYGANEWEEICERCEISIGRALLAGANTGDAKTLRHTRYDWSPGPTDPQLIREQQQQSMLSDAGVQDGHATHEQAYGDPELWDWLLQQRKPIRRRMAG